MAEKGTTKKSSATGRKKVGSTPTHPKTSEMVLAAVTELKDHKGTSLSAIKKYLSSTYKVDTDRMAIYIRRYLRKAVADGVLVQAKGSGATGLFKLPSAEKKPAKPTSGGKKRGRPAKTAAEGKTSTPKKTPTKKKQATPTKTKAKKTGATSAKKLKVKSAASTKKKTAGRPKSAKKSTPKKKK